MAIDLLPCWLPMMLSEAILPSMQVHWGPIWGQSTIWRQTHYNGENLEVGYSDFLYWLLTGPIESFYETFNWKNRDHDLKQVDGDHTFSFVPFLWTNEGHDLEQTDKRIIPVEEHYALTLELQKQLLK